MPKTQESAPGLQGGNDNRMNVRAAVGGKEAPLRRQSSEQGGSGVSSAGPRRQEGGCVDLEQLLIEAAQRGASDVHIVVGQPPILRINTELIKTDRPAMQAEVAAKMVKDRVGTRRFAQFMRRRDLDFSLD